MALLPQRGAMYGMTTARDSQGARPSKPRHSLQQADSGRYSIQLFSSRTPSCIREYDVTIRYDWGIQVAQSTRSNDEHLVKI
ncbi:MAG: hypothetical protein OXE92_11020 [Bacteroidetes bacterium]|nr:hypothetical protein [Bacteroidota bacterium]